MRKLLKVLHTLAACGLTGGLVAYMILLVAARQETAAGYADLRWSIAAISNYLLMPSLALALVSGLLSMALHRPFLEKRWAWVKALLGLLMFKGVLTIVGAKADYAAAVSDRIARSEAPAEALDAALAYEWSALIAILALSLANIVLGVWRPRLKARARPCQRPAAEASPASDGLPVAQSRPQRPPGETRVPVPERASAVRSL